MCFRYACRYWLCSNCTVGSNTCFFAHDLHPDHFIVATSANAASVSGEEVIDAAIAFPALSSATFSHNKNTSRSAGYLAAAQKPSTNTHTSSYGHYTEKEPQRKAWSREKVASVLREKGFLTSSASSLASAAAIPTASSSLRVQAREWVVSGDNLASEYENLRLEARQCALGRNKLLQEATLAFMGCVLSLIICIID